MLHSNFMKILVVMQVSARRTCRRAGNVLQNNADSLMQTAMHAPQTKPSFF